MTEAEANKRLEASPLKEFQEKLKNKKNLRCLIVNHPEDCRCTYPYLIYIQKNAS